MVNCPECETDLDIEEDEVDEGEVVSCPECGTDFEIITINPIELKPVEEEDLDEEEEEVAEDGDVSWALHNSPLFITIFPPGLPISPDWALALRWSCSRR